VGLSQGLLEDSARRQRGVGADILVRPPGTSALTLSGAPLPQKLVDVLGEKPHVTIATGMVNHPVSGITYVAGIDPETFNRMSGGFKFLSGHTFERPDDIIVDEYYARQANLHAGGTVNLLNRNWRVVGVVEPGILAHIVLPLRVLQDLTSNTGKVSQVFLKVDRPENIPAVIADLKKAMPNYSIYSMAEFTSLISVDNVPGLRAFIRVMVAIGVIIGFAVVCLSMYMAVLQRTREIGILKSLGASHWFILRLILTEAFSMAIGGALLGILLSLAARWIILRLVPASVTVAIVPEWWPIAGLITLAGALLGALYPGLTAARKDPIEALAYE
jgi:putative ABC transport system permease protein